MPERPATSEGLIQPATPRSYSGHDPERRRWLQAVAGSFIGVTGGSAISLSLARAGLQPDPIPNRVIPRDEEFLATERSVRKATRQPLRHVVSEHFRAIGDASESFMNLVLTDCEAVALDYLDYYRAKGFEVTMPDRQMTVVVFIDERPFIRFGPDMPPQVSGLYRRTENCLVLFDFRNVPMRQSRAGRSNMQTLAHEATHLLNFNTGLLNRKGDAPRSVIEGLATFSEVRRASGRTPPGQVNHMRLDDLAHVQRRHEWIPVQRLLGSDKAAFGNTVDEVLLAYAQSWFLVYHLMTKPDRLSQFRAYLKAILVRLDDTHRLDDAQKHFGDLAKLDKEVRQAAIELQRTR